MAFNVMERLTPSHVEPGVLMQYSQRSGAFETLADGKLTVQLDESDFFVYINTLSVRTRIALGQSAFNELPTPMIQNGQISTGTYLIRSRAEYNHHDTAMAGRFNVSLPNANRLAMRQAIFQGMRSMLLYGVSASNGEGLINTVGATAVNFPADPSNSATTLSTMSTGWIASEILQQIVNLKKRVFGVGIPYRIVVLGPQEAIGLMAYQVVSVTQFQRPGAGSNSILGTVATVAGWQGDEIIYVVDDTLIGKGAGGNDLIIITAPEIKIPESGEPDTNEFAKLAPGITAANLMYCDMAAPREIPTPIPDGGIDVVSELRATTGWNIRPEATTLLSVQYQ